MYAADFPVPIGSVTRPVLGCSAEHNSFQQLSQLRSGVARIREFGTDAGEFNGRGKVCCGLLERLWRNLHAHRQEWNDLSAHRRHGKVERTCRARGQNYGHALELRSRHANCRDDCRRRWLSDPAGYFRKAHLEDLQVRHRGNVALALPVDYWSSPAWPWAFIFGKIPDSGRTRSGIHIHDLEFVMRGAVY